MLLFSASPAGPFDRQVGQKIKMFTLILLVSIILFLLDVLVYFIGMYSK